MVYKDPVSGTIGICLKEAKEYMEKRHQAILDLMEEKNLSFSDISTMSMDEIMAFRKEVEKRLTNG